MKFMILSMITALAAASPISLSVEAFQTSRSGNTYTTSNDLENGKAGACPKVILIFARATFEPGNIGISLGPIVSSALKHNYGADNVWVQGVGAPYDAIQSDNFLAQGTSQAAIGEAVSMFNDAYQKCPGTPIVAGGYSQGTAVMAASIPTLSETVRQQIKGVVLFGYTRNAQNNGRIDSYPEENVKVFCAEGDLVCNNTLIITPAHFAYAFDAAGPAPQFLESKLDATS